MPRVSRSLNTVIPILRSGRRLSNGPNTHGTVGGPGGGHRSGGRERRGSLGRNPQPALRRPKQKSPSYRRRQDGLCSFDHAKNLPARLAADELAASIGRLIRGPGRAAAVEYIATGSSDAGVSNTLRLTWQDESHGTARLAGNASRPLIREQRKRMSPTRLEWNSPLAKD